MRPPVTTVSRRDGNAGTLDRCAQSEAFRRAALAALLAARCRFPSRIDWRHDTPSLRHASIQATAWSSQSLNVAITGSSGRSSSGRVGSPLMPYAPHPGTP